MLKECGLSEDFSDKALQPLFLGNAKKIADLSAAAALTGPVERADAGTVEKHLQALEGETKEIYRLLSRQLIKIAKRKNLDRDYESLQEVLQKGK